MAENKQDNVPETISAHLEHIAEQLWSDSPVVMVGACYSLLAD
ncbi:hypothetical protein [Rheinheimera tilapiae]|uniref:Uncharacterized protein n=1 Tax=Rheinheimera tilapiae TaxID=875043 RepID=A0ABV6BIU0_9GAMM